MAESPIELVNIERYRDWKDRLTTFITTRLKTPFEWGTHDCALWSADCVNTMTGVDFAKNARKTYDSAIGAYKCLERVYGVSNLKQVYRSRFAEIHVAYAHAGDVVYKNCNQDGFDCAIGICYGQFSLFVYDGEIGLTRLPTLSLDGAFRI